MKVKKEFFSEKNVNNRTIYSFGNKWERHRLDCSLLEQEQVAGSCESDDEPSGSIKRREFLD
jgi:hypothetical protein